MIPDDTEERKRLVEWVWRDLVAEWYQCEHAKARAHCVHEPSIARFQAMAERVVRSIERFEPGLPFPDVLERTRTVAYQDDSGGPAPPPPPKVVAESPEPADDADLLTSGG